MADEKEDAICSWKSKFKEKKCDRPCWKDSEHCLFHKPDKTKEESRLFWTIIKWDPQNDLKEITRNFPIDVDTLTRLYRSIYMTNRMYFDFQGFQFPEGTFQTPNKHITAFAHYDFNEAVFHGRSHIYNSFDADALFENVKFKLCSSFFGSEFRGRCFLRNTSFGGVLSLGQSRFDKTFFQGSSLIIEDIDESLDISGVQLSDNTVVRIKNVNYEHDPSAGRRSYQIAKNSAMKVGDYSLAGEYYYKEREYNNIILKQQSKEKRIPIEYLFDEMIKLATGYGEKPERIMISSGFVIALFSIIYMLLGFDNTIGFLDNTYNALVLSIGSFSTLGFFGNLPISSNLMIYLAIESLIGIFMMGLFILTISKKYAR